MPKTHYATSYIHKVGDGRHLINDNIQFFGNGGWQEGDSSDICIIYNAQRLCSTYKLPDIWELWTLSYPQDPMDGDDAACILSEAAPYTAPCDFTIPDNRADALKDLRSMGCDTLAALILQRLDSIQVVA